MRKIVILISVVLFFFTSSKSTPVEEANPQRSEDGSSIVAQRLIDVLDLYAELSNKDVDIVAGIFSPRITVQAQQVTVREKLNLIENELAENGIGLFQISSNRVVAAWLDPVKDPARKFLNYCKENKKTFDMAPVEINTRMTPELLALKKERDDSLKNLRAIRMKHEEYKSHMETWKGIENKSIGERAEITRKHRKIVSRLLDENEAYRKADRNFNELSYAYWIEYLEHAINDFEEREFIFPLLWILEY